MDILSLTKRIIRDMNPINKRFISLDYHIKAAMDWLCVAQDASTDGGVSLRHSLLKGWETSYPETTGYIIPTFLSFATLTENVKYYQRAIRMADWELSIQQRDGSFKGGPLGSGYSSFVFDTGQIIFGLLDAHRVTKQEKYIDGAIRAGKWLVSVQNLEGMWRDYTYNNIPHVYYTMVAWALAELGLYIKDDFYSNAAIRNIDWALSRQHDNGWFDDAGFNKKTHSTPYTHTIAYTIEGIMKTGICIGRDDYIDGALKAGKALLEVCKDGFLYGTYDSQWKSDVNYSCLTGNAQIAGIFLRLYEVRGSKEFFHVAQEINRFLCYCQDVDGEPSIRGAISGSYPIWGKYQRFAFPNWATKFFVDALLLEKKLNEV